MIQFRYYLKVFLLLGAFSNCSTFRMLASDLNDEGSPIEHGVLPSVANLQPQIDLPIAPDSAVDAVTLAPQQSESYSYLSKFRDEVKELFSMDVIRAAFTTPIPIVGVPFFPGYPGQGGFGSLFKMLLSYKA